MQCAFCGATLHPGSKTCSQCGAEVAGANPPVASIPQEEPIPEAFPYVDPSQPVEPPAAAPEPEPAPYAPATFADIAAAADKATPVTSFSGLAIASLVLGVLSLCSVFFGLCGAPIPIIGLVLGILSLRKTPILRNLAIGGIALNGVGLLLAIVYSIAILAMGVLSSSGSN
jgi:hypothetical protein